VSPAPPSFPRHTRFDFSLAVEHPLPCLRAREALYAVAYVAAMYRRVTLHLPGTPPPDLDERRRRGAAVTARGEPARRAPSPPYARPACARPGEACNARVQKVRQRAGRRRARCMKFYGSVVKHTAARKNVSLFLCSRMPS